MWRLGVGLVAALAVALAAGGCAKGSEEPETTELSVFEEDCIAQCEFEAGCFDVDAETCGQGCAVIDGVYPDECKRLYGEVARCEVALGCDGAREFAEGPREHVDCGVIWTDFVTACGYGGGAPPAECDAFCATAETCAPESVYATCPDNCAVSLGLYDRIYGFECAGAVLDINACEAALSCEEFLALLDGVAPTSCLSAGQAASNACQ